jgi:hypothetical protein
MPMKRICFLFLTTLFLCLSFSSCRKPTDITQDENPVRNNGVLPYSVLPTPPVSDDDLRVVDEPFIPPKPEVHVIDADGVIILVSGEFDQEDSDNVVDIKFVHRAEMAELARDDGIWDITDIVLSSGIPEAYYAAGWQNGRIYGLTLTPLMTDSFLLYNKRYIHMAGIGEMPGDLFDRGDWSRDDFYDYCLVLSNLLPPGVDAIHADTDALIKRLVYANGGFIYHVESGVFLENTPSIVQASAFVHRMTENGILQPMNEEVRSAIYTGGISELAEMIEEGVDVGIVPYPWGNNVNLASNYRAAATDADIAVFMRNGSDNNIGDLINLLYNVFNMDEALAINRERERQGQAPANIDLSPFERLHPSDYARLEWLMNVPVMILPEELR